MAPAADRIHKELWSALGEGEPVVVLRFGSDREEAAEIAQEIAKWRRAGDVRPERRRDHVPHQRVDASVRARAARPRHPLPRRRRSELLRPDRGQGPRRVPPRARQSARHARAAPRHQRPDARHRGQDAGGAGRDGRARRLSPPRGDRAPRLDRPVAEGRRVARPLRGPPRGPRARAPDARFGASSRRSSRRRDTPSGGVPARRATLRWTRCGTSSSSCRSRAEFDRDRQGTLQEFLEQSALLTDADRDDPDPDKVTLLTVHAAKGLEFGAVVVVGVEDDLIPFATARDKPVELDEERRLLHVAMTRAKRRLILTCAATRTRFGRDQSSSPSRFLQDLGNEGVEWRGAGSMTGRSGPPGLALELEPDPDDPLLHLRPGRWSATPEWGLGKVRHVRSRQRGLDAVVYVTFEDGNRARPDPPLRGTVGRGGVPRRLVRGPAAGSRPAPRARAALGRSRRKARASGAGRLGRSRGAGAERTWFQVGIGLAQQGRCFAATAGPAVQACVSFLRR